MQVRTQPATGESVPATPSNIPLSPARTKREDVIRVAIVDDHPIMRDGLVYTLSREDDFEVVAQGATADEAIHIAEALLPHLILLDINMPGDGLKAARIISSRCPAVRIVVLTAHDREQHVVDALRGGASGYIVKGVSSEELIKTVRSVHGGEAHVTPALAARLLGMRGKAAAPSQVVDRFIDLNTREEQILSFVSAGYSNREIGETIGLSERTVKHYMTNILQKLHVRNRVDAAVIACERLGEQT
jgi:two-component system, NarL family, nitrate/nitrite response regulator NarL